MPDGEILYSLHAEEKNNMSLNNTLKPLLGYCPSIQPSTLLLSAMIKVSLDALYTGNT